MPDSDAVVTDVVPRLDREIEDMSRRTAELHFSGIERLRENVADYTQKDMFRVDEIVVEMPGYLHG